MSTFRLQQQNNAQENEKALNSISERASVEEDAMRNRDQQNPNLSARTGSSSPQSQRSTMNWVSSMGSVEEDAMRNRDQQNPNLSARTGSSSPRPQERKRGSDKNKSSFTKVSKPRSSIKFHPVKIKPSCDDLDNESNNLLSNSSSLTHYSSTPREQNATFFVPIGPQLQNIENRGNATKTMPILAISNVDVLTKLWDEFPKIDKTLSTYMEELVNAALKRVLTLHQVILFIHRIKGKTYKEIRTLISSKGDAPVSTLLERTALGIRWDRDDVGRLSVLSDVDKDIFIEQIYNAVMDINCVATCTANSLVIQLNRRRLKKARYLLKCAGCSQLASKVSRNFKPDKTWLGKFCEKNGIRIVNSQKLEAARRSHCDVRAIRNFFSQFAGLFDRDHRLIFNMDETMMNSNRKFKVLVTNHRLPLVTTQTKFPHITACICFSAAGYLSKTLIILPNKATLEKLEKYEEIYHIASTATGWMNHDIFFHMVLVICW